MRSKSLVIMIMIINSNNNSENSMIHHEIDGMLSSI
jgi:hypothetical protein